MSPQLSDATTQDDETKEKKKQTRKLQQKQKQKQKKRNEKEKRKGRGMWNPDQFKSEDFDVVGLINQITGPSLVQQSMNHSQGPELSLFFFFFFSEQEFADHQQVLLFKPQLVMEALNGALEEIQLMSNSVESKIMEVQVQKAESKRSFKSSLSNIQDFFAGPQIATLENIEGRLFSITNSIGSMGDRLEQLDRQCERAEEAKRLFHQFEILNQSSSSSSSALAFTLSSNAVIDKEQVFEQAEIIRKLSSITQDLSSDKTKTVLFFFFFFVSLFVS